MTRRQRKIEKRKMLLASLERIGATAGWVWWNRMSRQQKKFIKGSIGMKKNKKLRGLQNYGADPWTIAHYG
ncbi:MAG: hypothetical protein JWM20_80 [Patescibacteria group bacterium]|nr:hypothetical protein [Patescibacteria group bacterium]